MDITDLLFGVAVRSQTLQKALLCQRAVCYSKNMGKTEWTRLLEIQRAGVTERTIFGAIAWATPNGKLKDLGTDPLIFGRSLMKPYQMKAIARELDSVLDAQEKAIALSSHNGTEAQIKIAKQILNPADWKLLGLPPAAPMGGFTAEKTIWSNPCSGKHSAILRACQLRGWPGAGYLEKDHPYNQNYIKTVEKALGASLGDRIFAPDGCLLPTFSVRVSELAKLYAVLARDHAQDWIWEAHHRHPELIGGEGRLDTRLLENPDLLAKEGADGLLGLSLRSEKYPDGLGVVIKLTHGYDMHVAEILAREVLRDLGVTFDSRASFPGQTYEYLGR